jgi:DNA-binding response OmpR family regulator
MDQGPSPKRILVVDDEEDMQSLLCCILETTGYVVECADDGRQALDKIGARRPDLVILDLVMPVLDGWGVLEALGERADRPPVVIVSAYADHSRAMDLGAVTCLSKPFRLGDLLDACQGAMKGASGDQATASS